MRLFIEYLDPEHFDDKVQISINDFYLFALNWWGREEDINVAWGVSLVVMGVGITLMGPLPYEDD